MRALILMAVCLLLSYSCFSQSSDIYEGLSSNVYNTPSNNPSDPLKERIDYWEQKIKMDSIDKIYFDKINAGNATNNSESLQELLDQAKPTDTRYRVEKRPIIEYGSGNDNSIIPEQKQNKSNSNITILAIIIIVIMLLTLPLLSMYTKNNTKK